jgi:S-adenosylmethionine:tRNA ribosyltransferase-isomerase
LLAQKEKIKRSMVDLSLYDYTLPRELIAQKPYERRDAARLLVLNRSTGEIKEDIFSNIINYLVPGDVLILNDTRVLHAKVSGYKFPTGGKINFLFLKKIGDNRYECLLNPKKKIKAGAEVIFKSEEKECRAVVEDVSHDRVHVIVKFPYNDFDDKEFFAHFGEVPLPPYVKGKIENPEMYQTVYSRKPGGLAAPTAGLHFTEELLEKIKSKNINIGYLTLHPGPDSIRMLKEEDFQEGLPGEYYEVPEETLHLVMEAKHEGKRIVAVGTTVVRVLEHLGNILEVSDVSIKEHFTGVVSLFIFPPYKFKIVDALVTNFHLPRSTHLLLVCAFAADRDKVFRAYKYAIEKKFKFYSFGDAMFIV